MCAFHSLIGVTSFLTHWTPVPTFHSLDDPQDILFTDKYNHVVRRIASLSAAAGAGQIMTVVGTGASGLGPENVAGTSAQLNEPSWLVVQGTQVYISDTLNNRIRVWAMDTNKVTVGGWSKGLGWLGPDPCLMCPLLLHMEPVRLERLGA